jgi:hypothetical protein
VLVLPGQPARADDLDAIRKQLADANAQTARVLNEIKSLDSKTWSGCTRTVPEASSPRCLRRPR